jgi:hypothetical protein
VKRRIVLALMLAATAVCAARATPAEAVTPPQPQLVLRAASNSVVLYQFRHHRVQLDLGMYLESLGADFRLNATRAYGGPIHVNQQVGAMSRPLPDAVAAGWNGISQLFRYTVRSADGTVVATRTVDFCPNQWDRQRVDGSGPLDATFPQFCGANPFALGAVWGIDKGWAATLADSAPTVKLPIGGYAITVRIMHRYTALFAIPPTDAVVTVSADVQPGSTGGCPPFCEAARPAAPRETPIAAPTMLSPDPATMPDLVALPAWGIDVRHTGRRDVLDFGATVWDAGPAPMVVEGYRRPDSTIMDAYEYFLRNGQVIGRAPAGTMVYDPRPGHQHWHFEQFARYSLLSADKSEVVRSTKQAFCLAPTDAIDLTAPHALWNPYSIGLQGACGDSTSIWTRETLPVGWGDSYYQYLPGQSFSISHLPNGTYWIRIEANPDGVLHEVSTANDQRLRRVILGGTPGHRTIRVPAWHGIVA